MPNLFGETQPARAARNGHLANCCGNGRPTLFGAVIPSTLSDGGNGEIPRWMIRIPPSVPVRPTQEQEAQGLQMKRICSVSVALSPSLTMRGRSGHCLQNTPAS